MEESISLLEQIRRQFQCGATDIRIFSPLTMAYVGDAVYDLVVRTVVVERGNRSANALHRQAIQYVNAGTQARMAEALKEVLTEEETDIYRWGHNAKINTKAKNASLKEYRQATGLEALLGYLYMNGRTERLLELVREGIERSGMHL